MCVLLTCYISQVSSCGNGRFPSQCSLVGYRKHNMTEFLPVTSTAWESLSSPHFKYVIILKVFALFKHSKASSLKRTHLDLSVLKKSQTLKFPSQIMTLLPSSRYLQVFHYLCCPNTAEYVGTLRYKWLELMISPEMSHPVSA